MTQQRWLIAGSFGVSLACSGVLPPALEPLSAHSSPARDVGVLALPLALVPAPVPTVAGAPSAACEGAGIDLKAAFASAACYVLASSLGTDARRFPTGIEVQLDSEPTRLQNHESAVATFMIQNMARNPATLYFQPVTLRERAYISATVTLVKASAHAQHLVGGTLLPSPFGPDHLARVVVAPGGRARLVIPWCAARTEGHPVRMAPPDWVPLEPGAYVLTAHVDMPIRPRGDHERTPTLAIQILPGQANSLCTDGKP